MSSPPSMRTRRLGTAALTLLLCSCQLLSIPTSLGRDAPSATAVAPVPADDLAETPPPEPTPWPLEPTLPIQGEDAEAALLPAFARDADLYPDATRYTIDASVTFEPESYDAEIEGRARIQYTVPTGATIDDVPLMLWPNDRQYASRMRVGAATINGRVIEGEPGLDGVVQIYRLEESASSGEVLDISVPFQVDASGPIGGPQPRRFGITEGVLIAPTFYPLIPRRVGGDWQVEPAPYGGDTTNSDTAFYRVTLTVPADLSLAASGVEVARTEDGDTQTLAYVSGPMRDFAFALGPFELKERTVDGVVVRAWTLPEHEVEAQEMLDAAAEQLLLMNKWVGSYPYAELDVVDAPGAFGGIEYPGLVYIGTLGTPWLIEPTVHEVAHQWFYGLIGDDQLFEPWLDEAVATYTEILYYEDAGPPGAATGLLSHFRQGLRSAPDPTLPIGKAVGAYADPGEYGVIVYYKGALFLDALRGEIGEAAFRQFLQEYYADFRYGFATGEDFQAAAEQACACDLDPLFDLWVWEGGEIPGL